MQMHGTPPLRAESLQRPSPFSQSSETGLEMMSWPDCSESDLADLPQDHHFNQIRGQLAIRTLTGFRSHASGPDQALSGYAQPYGSSQTPSNTSSGSRKGKRKRGNGASDDNDEDRPSRRRATGFSNSTGERLLACPFCKNNPRRYRDCYKFILRDVSRLKWVACSDSCGPQMLT
jgi:hypothetical protein